jgi:hypothetical protein
VAAIEKLRPLSIQGCGILQMPQNFGATKILLVGQGGGILKIRGVGLLTFPYLTTESLQTEKGQEETRSDGYSKVGIENLAM